MEQPVNLSDPGSITTNRLLYSMCMLAAVILFFTSTFDNALIAFCIAILFDPFNPAVKWPDRPLPQRVLLLTHVILEFAGFAYIFIIK